MTPHVTYHQGLISFQCLVRHAVKMTNITGWTLHRVLLHLSILIWAAEVILCSRINCIEIEYNVYPSC